ncbi:MAG: STAS domain-containing protein [Acholeplasmatales bacterium]|nr:STAS domain-containing protein [Acholeplasmatales bacterium]
MDVNVELIENKLYVRVAGRLDTNTAPELEGSIKNSLDGVKELNLDLKDLDYISSAGLRIILMFHKQMTSNNGKLFVLSPKDEVMEVFDMTGFSTFLNIRE